MFARFALLTAALVTLGLAPARSASAAPAAPIRIVVDSIAGQPLAGKPELWAGTVRREGPRAPEVPECVAVSCDRVQVRIDLPAYCGGSGPAACRLRSGSSTVHRTTTWRWPCTATGVDLPHRPRRSGPRNRWCSPPPLTARTRSTSSTASRSGTPDRRRRSPMKGWRRSSTIRSSIRCAICSPIWSRCRRRT